jgi:hypothetical protein
MVNGRSRRSSRYIDGNKSENYSTVLEFTLHVKGQRGKCRYGKQRIASREVRLSPETVSNRYDSSKAQQETCEICGRHTPEDVYCSTCYAWVESYAEALPAL